MFLELNIIFRFKIFFYTTINVSRNRKLVFTSRLVVQYKGGQFVNFSRIQYVPPKKVEGPSLLSTTSPKSTRPLGKTKKNY